MDWHIIKKMNNDEVKEALVKTAEQIHTLGNYLDVEATEENHNRFLDDFSKVHQQLHDLRHKIDAHLLGMN